MEKKTKQKIKKQHSFVLPLFIIFCVSCTPELVVEQFASHEKKEDIITALTPEPVSKMEPLSGSNMILESGNYWTIGIPGFGENALSAFIGEYRIPGKTKTVKIWLTGEFIYYIGWKDRNSIPGILVREKMGNDGMIVASALGSNWTAVMQLPVDEGLSEQDENRIIVNLISKFSGISGLESRSGQASAEYSGQGQYISFPAFIAYE